MPASSRSRSTSNDPSERKTDRLELRVTASTKSLIQRAAAISGLTAGDLAYEGARRILEEHERMRLVGTDRAVFLAALLEPPEPTERLVSALKRHRDLLG